jgi:outer membrane lipoprotein-sorting protein
MTGHAGRRAPRRGNGARAVSRVAGILAAVLALSPGAAAGAPSAPETLPDGRTVMERCVRAWYYAGTDMIAFLRMDIFDAAGEKHYRTMTMLRKNATEGGDQRYLLYFHEPGDVRRMTCMVYKHEGGDDSRWMYVPAANRVRAVSAPERSRFLGSDFVREEFAGRDAEADSQVAVRYERLKGHPCWVVEGRPRGRVDFTGITTWVDTTTYLPWRQEFRNRRNEVFRTFTADRVKDIRAPDGRKIPTIMERTLWGRDAKTHTSLKYESIRYDVGLTDADFSEAHLSVPLDSWYQGPAP